MGPFAAGTITRKEDIGCSLDMREIFAVLKDRLVVYATGIWCSEGGGSGQEEERCTLGQGTIQEGDNGCEELRIRSVQVEAGFGIWETYREANLV